MTVHQMTICQQNALLLTADAIKCRRACNNGTLHSCNKNPFDGRYKKENIFWRKQLKETMGLYHPLDGITNLEHNLLCFLTPNKITFSKQKALAFNRDRCWHLALCLQLILFRYKIAQVFVYRKKWQVMGDGLT